jgi:hypothetical protein
LTVFVLKLVIGGCALVGSTYSPNVADAGILQWRNRVATGAANPDNVGSYTNTIEMRDDVGATTGYDVGLDVDLDTSIVPNDDFFVSYVPHETWEKVESEFTPQAQIGDTYTSYLSFESNDEPVHFLSNTIEFLSMDLSDNLLSMDLSDNLLSMGLSDNLNGVTDFSYDLKIATNGLGAPNFNYFDTGSVSDILAQATPELTSWEQLILPGQDHRNGWFYGELTFTATGTPPTFNADFNSSGSVDADDLVNWSAGFGMTGNAVLSDGDADFDLDVDGIDFLTWQRQLGNTTSINVNYINGVNDYSGVYTNANGVPEPSSLGLAGIVAGAGAGYSLVNGRKKV